MERASNKHSPRVDEQLEQEVRGTLQGVTGGRAEEWKMAEPPGEDQPDATRTVDADQANDLSEFGRFIGMSGLPGDREAVRASAEALNAPDWVLADIDSLPEGVTYGTVTEIWSALGRGRER